MYKPTFSNLEHTANMAPSAITPPSDSSSRPKPVAYMLDTLHPTATELASSLFNCILPTDPEVAHWREHAKYLLVRGSHVTAADIASSPHLLAIGKQGVGTEKIDSNACSARGIKVLNTPGVNSQAVAELVLALSLAVARQIGTLTLRQHAGEAVPKQKCEGLLLRGCTLGAIGMGNIGRTVAGMFAGAFGATIIGYDPYMGEGAWAGFAHKRVRSLPELLSESDVVTIHVPLTPETRNLICYEQMAQMKRAAVLINTARGGIVHEEHLCRALEDGLIWGAGLDCHEQEPPTRERYERLWRQPNVVSLPHVGAATAQTQMETACAAVERLYAYAKAHEEGAAAAV